MANITKSWRSAIAAGGLALGLMTPVSMALADSDPHVVSPNSTAYGYKYSAWSAQWWQFVFSFSLSENPLFDDDGSKCVFGQRGPVWFLLGDVGGTVVRDCSIPAGKALFFPVINTPDINVANQSAKELRAEIAPCIDSVTALSVTVDGVPVRDLREKFRVRSEVFEITFPPGGFIDGGTFSPVVDDGYYVLLKPLEVGPHTIHIVAAWSGAAFCDYPFALDVTYNLTVMPVSLD